MSGINLTCFPAKGCSTSGIRLIPKLQSIQSNAPDIESTFAIIGGENPFSRQVDIIELYPYFDLFSLTMIKG